MQTGSTVDNGSTSKRAAAQTEASAPTPETPPTAPLAATRATKPFVYREPPALKDKHVYCVVSRLLTNKVYVSGGYERPHLAAVAPNMVVVMGDIRYCIHFRSLKGVFPDYLDDENLMRVAQDSAEKLIIHRYGTSPLKSK